MLFNLWCNLSDLSEFNCTQVLARLLMWQNFFQGSSSCQHREKHSHHTPFLAMCAAKLSKLKLLSAYHTNTTSSANFVESFLKVTLVIDYIEKFNTVVGN